MFSLDFDLNGPNLD